MALDDEVASSRSTRAVRPFGLTHAQYSLLASLRGMTYAGRRPTRGRLADHTGLHPIFVSKLISTLDRNGLVERSQHPTDARAVELALTDAGVDIIDRAVVAVLDLQDQLTQPLGGRHSKETKQFIVTMQRLLAVQNPQPRGDLP